MSEALVEPQAHADQRLALTIVIAMAVHALVVLGVRLPAEAPIKSRFAAMEVVLMPTPSARADAAATARDAIPLLATDPSVEAPTLPVPPVARPPVKAAPLAKPAPVKPAVAKAPPRTAPAPPAAATPAAPLPTATQLFERSMAIAATGAGLIEDKTLSGQSLAERTLYIKNNTRDFTQATYKDDLVRKARAFGQLFQRAVPAGRLVMDVAIGPDGSLLSASITKSSGIAATDAEAIRILEQAAPFAPMPPALAKKYEVLHIELPWNFTQDAGFSHGQ